MTRPISLSPLIGKHLEYIMEQGLQQFSEDSRLLSNVQFELRKEKSTTDALRIMMGKLNQYKSDNISRWFTFIDVKRALNTIYNVSVVDRMIKMEVPNYLTTIVESFLSQRKVVLELQEFIFVHDIVGGWSQASPLSPTLFMLMLNEVLYFPLQSSLVVFAGDLALEIKASHSHTKRILEGDLYKIANWCFDGWLSLSWATRAVLECNKYSTVNQNTSKVFGGCSK